MNMKDFAKYLTYTSFQEALHKVRRVSLERILASESLIETIQRPKDPQAKKIA